jgi:hypothetical protein
MSMAHRLASVSEDYHEIAEGLHLEPTLALDTLADGPAMHMHQLVRLFVVQRLKKRREALDIREQNR